MREKCPKCCFKTDWGYSDGYLTMNRLYVKRYEKGKWRWIQVGWLCPNCGFVKLDANFPLKHYKTVTTRAEAKASPAQYTGVPVMTAPAPLQAPSKPTFLEPRQYTELERAARFMIRAGLEDGREVERKIKELFRGRGYDLKEEEEKSEVGGVVIMRRTIRVEKGFSMGGFMGVAEDFFEGSVSIYVSVYDAEVAKALQDLLEREPNIEVSTI
jgi:hypothetical protein